VAVLFAAAQVGPPRVEQLDAALDALERLDDVALQTNEHVDGVFVRTAPDLLGVRLGLADDPPALRLGLLREASFVDQERRLLLRPGDDPLGLFLRLLDDPLALGVDALRGADLLGDRDAELVDESERGRLVDDDVVGQRQPLPVRDDRLEALDEEDDVRRDALRAVDRAGCRTRPRIAYRSVAADYRTAVVARSASTAAAGTIPVTSPPNAAISFTSDDET
jgi:hypothetical protein